MTFLHGFLFGLAAGLAPSVMFMCFLAWKLSARRSKQVEQPPADQAEPKHFGG
jgi:hypothetical protein